MKKMRLLLADDHAILRFGLHTYLNGMDDMVIVGEAEDGDECLKLYYDTSPDVCVVDIEMPQKSGLDVLHAIREQDQQTKFIILSMHSDAKTIRSAFRAGSNGYIVKDMNMEAITNAIRSVSKGEKVILNEQQASFFFNKNRGMGAKLTKRELEILQLVVEGYSSPQIAAKLFISSRTVDTHRNNLMKKVGIKNTASLVRYALQYNLVRASSQMI